jgi:peroxiredoxin
MKFHFLRSNIYRFFPFIIIVLTVAFLLERQKSSSLPPPGIEVNTLDVRSPHIWDFALPALSGKIIHLSDFKGSVVLLNFFATWCPPCREEMPSLEEAFQANKDKGFVVLGIAGDTQGKEIVEPFMKDYGLTFPVLLDPENQVFKQYFVRGIPVTYLLDRQGRIAGMYPGEADWNSGKAQALIDHLVQEPYEEKAALDQALY